MGLSPSCKEWPRESIPSLVPSPPPQLSLLAAQIMCYSDDSYGGAVVDWEEGNLSPLQSVQAWEEESSASYTYRDQLKTLVPRVSINLSHSAIATCSVVNGPTIKTRMSQQFTPTEQPLSAPPARQARTCPTAHSGIKVPAECSSSQSAAQEQRQLLVGQSG